MRIEFMIERKKELGLTNATLAQKAGLPLTTTAKIMAGIIKDPKLHTLQALAKALECTIDDFYDVAPHGTSPPQNKEKLPDIINVEELSETKQALVKLAQSVPEHQAELLLRLMRAALGDDQE